MKSSRFSLCKMSHKSRGNSVFQTASSHTNPLIYQNASMSKQCVPPQREPQQGRAGSTSGDDAGHAGRSGRSPAARAPGAQGCACPGAGHAFPVAELHEIPASPFLQLAQVPPHGSTTPGALTSPPLCITTASVC